MVYTIHYLFPNTDTNIDFFISGLGTFISEALLMPWNYYKRLRLANAVSYDITIKQSMLNSSRMIEGLGCQNPYGINETVDIVQRKIRESIGRSITLVGDFRKAAILLSRCSRGGKTTLLHAIQKSFIDTDTQALLISFNGTTNFRRLPSESDVQCLFRVITNQVDSRIDPSGERLVDWEALDRHIGSGKFVLLVDEINVLGNRISSELASVLKSSFIDKCNRQLVMTSHRPLLLPLLSQSVWSESTSALSERSITLIPMPQTLDLESLRGMDRLSCTGITANFAAFHGGIPSLIYTVTRQSEESTDIRFSLAMPGTSTDMREFTLLVEAFVTGLPDASLDSFFGFISGVYHDVTLGIRTTWPLCYIVCICRRYAGIGVAQLIVECINKLFYRVGYVGDGMVWEESVRLAILFRLVLSVHNNWDAPFKLCENQDATNAIIAVVQMPPDVVSVENASTWLSEYAKLIVQKTFVSFVPTSCILNQFDGFLVLIENGKLIRVIAYQCKDSRQGSDGTVPSWIHWGYHFRAKPYATTRDAGARERRWTYYSIQETDNFLGPSLAFMRNTSTA